MGWLLLNIQFNTHTRIHQSPYAYPQTNNIYSRPDSSVAYSTSCRMIPISNRVHTLVGAFGCKANSWSSASARAAVLLSATAETPANATQSAAHTNEYFITNVWATSRSPGPGQIRRCRSVYCLWKGYTKRDFYLAWWLVPKVFFAFVCPLTDLDLRYGLDS